MFKDEVQKFVTGCLKSSPHFKAHFASLKVICISGNKWKPDIVITSSEARESKIVNYVVKLIGEVKLERYVGNRPKHQTHKEHMWRAGARFCDVRNYRIPKFVLFPYLEEKTGNFDFNAYFRSMDVTLLDWSKREHREMLRRTIKQL